MLQRGVSHASAAAGANQQLRAQAAELERQFEVYKLRLAEKRRDAAALMVVDHPNVCAEDGGGGGAGAEEDDAVGRGRRYEAYVRRRDEKLRQGWLARMERKEAEVKALWARLDQPRRPPHSADAAPREVKARNTEKPISPAAPKCTPAMKLPRLKSSTTPSSSPAAAASPRLSSSRRVASHPEPQPQPPATPRKENRMSPPSAAITTPRQLKTFSRTRSSFVKDGKEDRSGGRGFPTAVAARESPRPPRVHPPRASYDGGAGHRPKQAVVAAPEPLLRLRRSRASSPLVAPRQEQEDFFARLQENNARNKDAEITSYHSDAQKASNGNGDEEIARSAVTPPGDAAITGDSDTEPSYVYVKKDEEANGSCSELGETFEDTMASSSSSSEAEADKTVKENPAINGVGEEAGSSSSQSSESLYSNVQSSFSHGSELAADSPLRALSTEQLLEADAATLRKKRHEEEDDDEADQNIVILPSTGKSGAGGVQVVAGTPSPMVDAVAGGIKRFLAFGKKNTAAAPAAVVIVERAPPPAGDYDIVTKGRDSGDSNKPRICCSYAASDDDLDKSYVISPHGAVRSLQCFPPSSPTRPELKETAPPPPPARSPKVQRSFFSFSTFKNRGN